MPLTVFDYLLFSVIKGHVGGWKDKLTEEQNKIFAEKLEETFKDTGLTFDFELKPKK